MRVTEAVLYRNLTRNLGNLSSELQELNQQAATGKRLQKASDDPVGSAGAVSLHAKLDALAQQQRNIEFSQGWMKQTESAISSAEDVVSRARELAVQMSNGTYSVAQRQSAAKEVENLLEQMVSLANTKYGERYVFAGFRDDAAPFETTEAGGVVTAVTYQGDDGRREVKLGPGSRLETNLTGAEVFQGSGDVFEALINLRDALQANDPAAAAATIDDLRGAGNNLSAMAADMGARLNRCELRLNVIKDTQLADTDSLSKLEDADVVDVIVRLQSKELIYQAALKAATALQELNLAAYL